MIWLDKDELQFLTGYKRKRDQVKALAELGIPFRQRPAGGIEVTPRRAKRKRKPESCLSGVYWLGEDGSFRVFRGPFATPDTSPAVVSHD